MIPNCKFCAKTREWANKWKRIARERAAKLLGKPPEQKHD